MKLIYLPLHLLFVSLLVVACSASKPVSTNNMGQDTHKLLQQNVMAVLWYQRAAESRALYYQAFNLAHDRLDQIMAADTTGRKMAVVVDIDETVLSNSPWQAYSILNNAPYPEGWDEWIKSARADPTRGAVDFLNYAVSHGVDVYYISNRKQDNLQPTIENLKKWNFPEAEASHVLLKTTTSDKTERRAEVENTHEIVLMMGDNLGDFKQLFQGKDTEARNALVNQNKSSFGRRFIMLPNPMYGEWEGATYQYHYGKSAGEKMNDRLNALQSFDRNTYYKLKQN